MKLNKRQIQVKSLVGQSIGHKFLHINFFLDNVDKNIHKSIIDEELEVKILREHIFTGFILVQAKLIKNIAYKACKGKHTYIDHKNLIVPFEVEVPFDSVKKYNARDYLIESEVISLENDIIYGKMYPLCKEQNDKKEDSDDTDILFTNPSLAKGYQGKYAYDLIDKNTKHNTGKKYKQEITEKILIKIQAKLYRKSNKEIPVYKPGKVFHCSNKNFC